MNVTICKCMCLICSFVPHVFISFEVIYYL